MIQISGKTKCRGRAVSGEWGKTGGGKPQVVILFEITDGGPVPENRGETISWFGFFTDKTEETTMKGLRAAGVRGEDVTLLEGLGEVECELVLENETKSEGKYAGKTFPRVRWVNPLDKSGGKVKLAAPLSEAERRKLAAKLKPAAKKASEVKRDEPTTRAPADDVPF